MMPVGWCLAGCSLLSSTALLGLAQLTGLRELELTNCPAILVPPALVCRRLREALPRCVVVD